MQKASIATSAMIRVALYAGRNWASHGGKGRMVSMPNGSMNIRPSRSSKPACHVDDEQRMSRTNHEQPPSAPRAFAVMAAAIAAVDGRSQRHTGPWLSRQGD